MVVKREQAEGATRPRVKTGGVTTAAHRRAGSVQSVVAGPAPPARDRVAAVPGEPQSSDKSGQVPLLQGETASGRRMERGSDT